MQLSLLVQALESCLLEPPAAYIDQQSMDHWMLRQFAAHLLAKIIRFLSLSLSLCLSLSFSLSLSLSVQACTQYYKLSAHYYKL